MSTASESYPDFSGLTFEKVWAMFQETDKQMKETSLQMRETDRKIQETEKIVQANAQAIAETNQAIDRLEKSMDETTSRLAKSIENSNKEHGSLGNRFGEVIEHLIIPGVIPRLNERGFHFTTASTRVQIIDPLTDKTLTEMDIVLENGESIVVVEVKVDPSLSDVRKHIRRLQIYRDSRNRLNPNDGKKIFGAIAAAVFSEDVQEATLEAGFYVILQGGDTIRVAVPDGFEPKAF